MKAITERYGTVCAGRHELIEVVPCGEPHHSGCTVIRSLEEADQQIHIPTNAAGVVANILSKVPQL